MAWQVLCACSWHPTAQLLNTNKKLCTTNITLRKYYVHEKVMKHDCICIKVGLAYSSIWEATLTKLVNESEK